MHRETHIEIQETHSKRQTAKDDVSKKNWKIEKKIKKKEKKINSLSLSLFLSRYTTSITDSTVHIMHRETQKYNDSKRLSRDDVSKKKNVPLWSWYWRPTTTPESYRTTALHDSSEKKMKMIFRSMMTDSTSLSYRFKSKTGFYRCCVGIL